MFKAVATFKHWKLEGRKGELPKTYVQHLERLMRRGAEEWVRAVIIRIPVWTGMALGAVKYAKGRTGDSAGLFLASYLRVAVPIGPMRTADNEQLERRSDKSPELGGRAARYTFSHDLTRKVFRFTFNPGVEHLIFNAEVNHLDGAPVGSKGAGRWERPWETFAVGRKAMEDYVNANKYKNMPRLKDLLVEVRNISSE